MAKTFYNFRQNNSGGSFEVNDTLTHFLYIEADSYSEAREKALSLGVYFDGCRDGIDCSCCGDRWDDHEDVIDIDEYKTNGYAVNTYGTSTDKWIKEYSKYERMQEPKVVGELFRRVEGSIKIDSIEAYAQLKADKGMGWCTPEIRVFFKDGNVKSFSKSTE